MFQNPFAIKAIKRILKHFTIETFYLKHKQPVAATYFFSRTHGADVVGKR